jgi:hypothetical protein
MPRAKRSSAAAASTPAVDGNVAKATLLEHHDAIVTKLRLKKEADSALANAWKAAERDGISKKELKRVMDDNALTAEELAVRDRRHALYRAWLNRPVGFQSTMEMPASESEQPAAANGHAAPDEADQQHARNAAFEEGVVAGKAGADLASCAYLPGTEEHQQFSSGWAAGQRQAVEALGGATHTA